MRKQTTQTQYFPLGSIRNKDRDFRQELFIYGKDEAGVFVLTDKYNSSFCIAETRIKENELHHALKHTDNIFASFLRFYENGVHSLKLEEESEFMEA